MTKKRTKRITLRELYAEPFKPVEGAGGEAAAILEHQLGKPIARSERGQFAARDINNLIARSKESTRTSAAEEQLRTIEDLVDDCFGFKRDTVAAIKELIRRVAVLPEPFAVWSKYDVDAFQRYDTRWFYGVDGKDHGGPYATKAEALSAAAAHGRYQLYLYELKRAGGGL